MISMEENNVPELRCEETGKNSDILSNNETSTTTEISQNECISENLNETIKNCIDTKEKLEIINAQVIDKFETDTNHESISNIYQSCSNTEAQQLELKTIIENNIAEHQVENIKENIEANRNNDNKVKASLTEELLKLSNYGWYWGPISSNEADAKLISEPDGAFLVRDSSDDRFVLSFI